MKIILTIFFYFTAVWQVIGQAETVLTNVTIIDGTGQAAKTHAAVVIVGDKISAINIGKITVPATAMQIDMTGKYLMPAIINCHGHVGNLKGTTTTGDNYTPINVRRQLLQYQAYGVGTVLSMGTEQPVGVRLRDSSQAGVLPGAILYSAIYGFGVKGAMPPESMGMTHIYRPETAEEAILMVKELALLHPDVIKMWVDNFYGQYQQTMKEEIYTAIINEAHRHGIRVAAHLYHLADAHKLVAAGLDIMAHSIRDAEIDDALVAEMKAKKVIYIPTLSLDEFGFAYEDDPSWLNDAFFRNSLEPGVYEMITSIAYKEKTKKNPVTAQEKEALPIALKNLVKLFRAGILIALGTDSGANPLRAQGFSEHMEMELLVRAGLTPLEAIKIATQNGARLLRVESSQGSLQAGQLANFIVLDKNPLENIRNTRSILSVWKNGKKVSDGPLAAGR